MAPPSKSPGDRDDLLGTFVASATKLLAPNSLQFDDNEFELSPPEAKRAALEAAQLVQPGDLVFITTRGLLYSVGRFMTNNEYDHVVIVLDNQHVLHVGPPNVRRIALQRLLLPQRQPVVLRVPMTDAERQRLLRSAEQLVGMDYDVSRAYQLMLRLSLQHQLRRKPLRRLALDVRSDQWICSDAAIVLFTGCSERFRTALAKAKAEMDLDIFTHGSASFSDFMRIRQVEPNVLDRVRLPVLNYTLSPHKRPFKAYVGEFLDMVARIQSGNMRWPLLQETVLPKMRDVTRSIGPSTWSLEMKVQVLTYALVLLLVMKRGATVSRVLVRASQLLVLRYLVQQVASHVRLQDVARSMLARL